MFFRGAEQNKIREIWENNTFFFFFVPRSISFRKKVAVVFLLVMSNCWLYKVALGISCEDLFVRFSKIQAFRASPIQLKSHRVSLLVKNGSNQVWTFLEYILLNGQQGAILLTPVWVYRSLWETDSMSHFIYGFSKSFPSEFSIPVASFKSVQ